MGKMSASEEEELFQLHKEIKLLQNQLKEKIKRLNTLEGSLKSKKNKLSKEEITRYSRQMLTPQIRLEGQLRLKSAKVLIVGIGGLGCPAALYLSSAGVGSITIIDNDEVELSNLHRQILHSEADIGNPKVISAFEKLKSINNNIEIKPVHMHVDNDSMMKFLCNENDFNVVIDGTDNVATRYLLNDACVMYGLPLVSGSALQMEGQLTVYNYKNGPCYRCLYPVPPPPETVTSCGDGGVLGPVPGTIGTLQALEAIKIITNQPDVLSGRMLIFDGSNTTFRNVRLRPKSISCAVCGENPTITKLINYEQFCGARAHDKVININIVSPDENVKPQVLFSSDKKEDIVLIDVRPSLEYEMCNIPKSVNLPYSDILKDGESIKNLENLIELRCGKQQKKVYVICRRGNDSQRAIRIFKSKLKNCKFINVTGGLHSYAKEVDKSFPIY